ncbi:DNA-binding transcriptional regulator, IclR family [Raineyella antarctica]|uniref:Glycerol operon regulatory protein n=1 Tax=Raineyella antarctica TaxID=1577474 RepID=A0A1G6GXP3_9ACTN|nr:IclR family transcriptional regulator [Raineyella antarctica]SDB86683.1 DNA-binding transcriptional regulator, IclR family [Raineyella antarctica]
MTASTLDRPRIAPTTSAAPLRGSSAGQDNNLASVSKALMLLESLNATDEPAGVSALARSTGMPKSTAFRLLAYLEESGFVERAGKAYRLGRRLFELGNNVDYCRPDGVRNMALPYMTDLHSRTGMTVHLGVLEGRDVVYLEKIHGLRTTPVDTAVGGRAAASCSALGKALLAYCDGPTLRQVVEAGLASRTQYSVRHPGLLLQQLQETRRTAIAHDREESQLGISCVASPILVGGRAVAALSVSGPTRPVPAETHAALVRQSAAEISRRLSEAA